MNNKMYEVRVLQRLSQYVLALKTGISQPRISIIENSLVQPKEDEKKKIAKALGVKAEDIFPQEVSNEQ